MNTTFRKPDNLRTVDMCKYIDANIYRENLTEKEKNTIYMYIYWIAYLLAKKKKIFRNREDYDTFALDYASDIYMRMTDPRQFELKENGEPKLQKVVSVLNFIKATMHCRKNDWAKLNYKEIIDPEFEPNFDSEEMKHILEDEVQSTMEDPMREGFMKVIEDIPRTIKAVVNNTPYRNDKVMTKNLYLSLLISVVKSFTLSNENAKNLEYRKTLLNYNELMAGTFLMKEYDNSITLWHIDPELHDYVGVLYNKVKINLKNRLLDVRDENTLSTQVIKSILTSNVDFEKGAENYD